MGMQKCPICGKEFKNFQDGRPHTYCSRRCYKVFYDKSRSIDNKFRDELGVPQAKFCASDKKVE